MTLRDIFGPITIGLTVALVITALIGFLVIPGEAILPVHWDPAGEADGFMGRNGALLMPLGVAAVVLALMAGLVRFSRPEQIEPGRHLIRAVVPAIVGLFLVILVGTVLIGVGVEVNMVRLIALAFGVLLVTMGNMLPKTRPNAYAGIRLPWTLSDPSVWQAAHRAAGLASVIAGVLLIALAVATGDALTLLTGVVLAVVLPLAAGGVVGWRLSRRP